MAGRPLAGRMRRGSVLGAVLLGVRVDGLCGVVGGVHGVAVGHRRVMGSVVGLPRRVMDRRLLVVLGGLTVVLGGLLVVVRSFLCHTMSSGVHGFSVLAQVQPSTLPLYSGSPLV